MTAASSTRHPQRTPRPTREEQQRIASRLEKAVHGAAYRGEPTFASLEAAGMLIGTVVPPEQILFDLVDGVDVGVGYDLDE